MQMVANFLSNWPFGACGRPFAYLADPSGKREQRRVQATIDNIRSSASLLKGLTNDDFTRQAIELRQQSKSVEQVFAVGCEAVRRELGIELYDVQLQAGLALVNGAIAQVNTGEGKTLIALLPATWHAFSRRSMHVMTVNSYLARRDCELLKPIYHRIGLTVGLTDSELDIDTKRQAYKCDVVYGPGYEFGFDFLRDQLTLLSSRSALGTQLRDRLRGLQPRAAQLIQGPFGAALVDEADSVLLDEATSPLILSPGGGRPSTNPSVYLQAQEVCQRLQSGLHYQFDTSSGKVELTLAGRQAIEGSCPSSTQALLCRPWKDYVHKALVANCLFMRDEHYIVSSGQVQIVDQHTGRIFAERSWQDGLHQAVQAKERVTITSESLPAARVTRQRFLKRYSHLAGMTGTTQQSESELRRVYELVTKSIPPHLPSRRRLLPARFFVNQAAKQRSIVSEVERIHEAGQPILVGTTSIRASEELANALQNLGLQVRLLNGTQDQTEAEIVAQAGQRGAITIATNMAGRGTDIALQPSAREAGGLHVIAMECHESERVDQQLIGRAARQGDPGSAQFFVSAEDGLLARYAPKLAERIRQNAQPNGEVSEILSTDLMNQVRLAQAHAQQLAANARAHLYAHDDWLESILKNL